MNQTDEQKKDSLTELKNIKSSSLCVYYVLILLSLSSAIIASIIMIKFSTHNQSQSQNHPGKPVNQTSASLEDPVSYEQIALSTQQQLVYPSNPLINFVQQPALPQIISGNQNNPTSPPLIYNSYNNSGNIENKIDKISEKLDKFITPAPITTINHFDNNNTILYLLIIVISVPASFMFAYLGFQQQKHVEFLDTELISFIINESNYDKMTIQENNKITLTLNYRNGDKIHSENNTESKSDNEIKSNIYEKLFTQLSEATFSKK
ncbi:MAG: hypothetical protein G8237_06990 [Magnetococcales bacterium]|nr:hypothetical protein [Magnetococcales bacterium]NGZ06087.1 hypothetical protein [Magnetococcales bacterium]